MARGSVAQPGAADSPTLTSTEADSIRLTTVITKAWLKASSTTLRFMAELPEVLTRPSSPATVLA